MDERAWLLAIAIPPAGGDAMGAIPIDDLPAKLNEWLTRLEGSLPFIGATLILAESASLLSPLNLLTSNLLDYLLKRFKFDPLTNPYRMFHAFLGYSQQMTVGLACIWAGAFILAGGTKGYFRSVLMELAVGVGLFHAIRVSAVRRLHYILHFW